MFKLIRNIEPTPESKKPQLQTVRDVIDPHSSSVVPSQDLAPPAVSARYNSSPQSHQITEGQAITSQQAARMYPSSGVHQSAVQSLHPHDTLQIPGIARSH